MTTTDKPRYNNYIDLRAPYPLTPADTEAQMVELHTQQLSIESQLEMAEVKDETGLEPMDPLWRAKARTALRMSKARYEALRLHLHSFNAYQSSTMTIEYALAFQESVERLFEPEDLEDVRRDIENNYPHLKDVK